ncbi:ATP-binding protein [Bifidobacterium sp.]|uniref:ATP-binding protein n=1 Tax=Bifidobacterium sp. TaxID=41200 RepID=UPI0039E88122
MPDNEQIEFNFTWDALKLLGKSLYSNAWSAISELVANGIDAGASEVTVLVDARNKQSATIEIMDNGSGMDDAALNMYARIGFDRRQFALDHGEPTDGVMGRKGIGKLAALYLSDDYDLLTKTSAVDETCWNLRYMSDVDGDENPSLEATEKPELLTARWEQTDTGTVLKLRNVDLRHIGEVAFNQLSIRLANQFLTTSMHHATVKLAVIQNNNEAANPEFQPVKKAIAFHNLAFIATNFPDQLDMPNDIRNIASAEQSRPDFKESGQSGQKAMKDVPRDEKVLIPYRGRDLTPYQHLPRVRSMTEPKTPQIEQNPVHGSEEFRITGQIHEISNQGDSTARIDAENNTVTIPYQVTGWIGIHATIEQSAARDNDKNFTKDRWYNPNSLRLYVRDKLADENLLDKLGITQAFLNYVEGEISFDILDDDFLPDIATSSRQGFDELDKRWTLLISIVKPQVQALIRERQQLAEEQRNTANEYRSEVETNAKTEAVRSIRSNIRNNKDIPPEAGNQVLADVTQHLQGETKLHAKEDYIIFISHASRDKRLSDFIYEYMRHIGASEEEFFYTSSRDKSSLSKNTTALNEQIRLNLTQHNALVLYVTSTNFLDSDFAMFEAGAGWATKTAEEYQIMSVQHSEIPQCIDDNRYAVTLDNGANITLAKDHYSSIVQLLNELIKHLNKGRTIKKNDLLPEIQTTQIPTELELRQSGKTEENYWDPDVLQYWQQYVDNGITTDDAPLNEYEEKLSQARTLHSDHVQKLKELYK